MSETTFGETLDFLLGLRGWSAARLAKEMNLDSSYIRRWIRGERVPSLQSDHIALIADSVAPGLDFPSKRNELGEFIAKAGATVEAEGPLVDQIKQMLLSAQIRTLRLTSEARLRKKTDSLAGFDDFVTGIHRLPDSFDSAEEDQRRRESGSLAIEAIPSFCHGREQVLTAIVSLLEYALYRSDRSFELLHTFQSENSAFDGYPALNERWRQGIAAALRRGSRVRSLIRLDKNVNRSIALISEMASYLGIGGSYEPRYFLKYGTLRPPQEIVGIPGVGVLFCISSESPGGPDAAFFHKDRKEAEAIRRYFGQLESDTEPLLRYYSEEQYFEENMKKDRKKGDHLVNNRDLGALTIPLPLWEIYLKRSLGQETDVKRHMDRISERMKLFYENTRTSRVVHICPMAAIECLLAQGRYYASNRFRRPEGKDGVRHVKHLVELLRELDNFELTLVTDEQIRYIPLSYWEVKGDHTVTFGIPPTDRTNETYVSITEGTVAGAFSEYFHQQWQMITPKYREKEHVIAWLESRIGHYTG